MHTDLRNFRGSLWAVLGLATAMLAGTLVWFGASGSQGKENVVAAGEGGGYLMRASSYLDGEPAFPQSDWEQVRDVAMDQDGNVYLVGGTQTDQFPVTKGAYDTTFNTGGQRTGRFGEMDAFVTKVGPAGQLVWSTYLGGPNYDRAYAVEVDAKGYVYVAGRAGDGFPTTDGVMQPEFGGGDPDDAYGEQDAFVTKISPDGRTLVWSTYFVGPGGGVIRDIDIDQEGRVYIAAWVDRPQPTITPDAAQPELRGKVDAVYAKLSADGQDVLYATYYGGSDTDERDGLNPSIRVNRNGEVYLLSFTAADDIPLTAAAIQKHRAGGLDLMLAKYSADGALQFSTYLGGSDDEAVETHGLALDGESNPVVAAWTGSSDFPVTEGAFQRSRSGPGDGFIAKLSSDGARLLGATYLGGGAQDGIEGVAVSPSGAIVVTGATDSEDFPVTGNALQVRSQGDRDLIVTKLAPDLTHLLYSTMIGGSAQDAGRAIAIAASGEIAVGGQTMSDDFPMVGEFHRTLHGDRAAVYVKLMPQPE